MQLNTNYYHWCAPSHCCNCNRCHCCGQCKVCGASNTYKPYTYPYDITWTTGGSASGASTTAASPTPSCCDHA